MKTKVLLLLSVLSLSACTTTSTDSKGVVTTKSSSINVTPEQLAAVQTLLSSGIQDYKTIKAIK